MTGPEWVLFIVAGVLALKILTTLMTHFYQVYRQEYLASYAEQRRQESASPAPKESTAAADGENKLQHQLPTRKAA